MEFSATCSSGAGCGLPAGSMSEDSRTGSVSYPGSPDGVVCNKSTRARKETSGKRIGKCRRWCVATCAATRGQSRSRDPALEETKFQQTRFVVCTSGVRVRLLPRPRRRCEGERSSVRSVKVCANFLPRQSIDASRAVIGHAAFDFFCPRLFCAGGRRTFQAFE